MRNPYRIPPWKTAPFFRLLLPFMTGILLQWNINFHPAYIITSFCCFFLASLLIYFLPLAIRYLLRQINGIFIHCMIVFIAMIITWYNDPRHQPNWYGRYENDGFFVTRIEEPLTPKANSYKALGIVKGNISKDHSVASGKILLYFSKDSAPPALKYGDYIIIKKIPQPITNSGNPGGFDYKRYASFQQVFHQVFLKRNEWRALPIQKPGTFQGFLFTARDNVLQILRTYIKGKEALSIAEALLIGYNEDLDKDLVQAYSNTGVVHIIAISGLHLGLIFFVLSWILNRVPLIRSSSSLKAILLITSLWLFALLTGGSASVLRSAVMFTTIIIGKSYFKNMPVSNCLSSSAFILLCYNPYFLWDVGFQLSYLAIFGILFIQQPLYKMIYIKNRWLNKVWQMTTVTIAAQVLTFPVCLYYFHQFPVTFLFSNLVAVPLSTLILFSEIFLLIISGIPAIAVNAGRGIAWMIEGMNSIIRFFSNLPYSLIDNVYADLLTTILLYGIILFLGCWLFYRNKLYLRLLITTVFLFTGVWVHSRIRIIHQKKIIVYNIPRHSAIDFIYHSSYRFYGDSILLEKGLLRNFHLRPARVSFQLKSHKDSLPGLINMGLFWKFGNKTIMIIDSNYKFQPLQNKIPLDMLLIRKSPAIHIRDLLQIVQPAVIVLDGSNSLWKIAQWKKECEHLLLRCHSVPAKGAFILNIE